MPDDHNPSLTEQAGTHIGYDPRFETHWCRFERIVWAFFIVVLFAVLLGVLGRGPLNSRSIRREDGTSIRYERVVRFLTPTTIQCELPVNNGSAELLLDKTALDKLGLRMVLPQPTRYMGSVKVGPLFFEANPHDSKTVLVQLQFEPGSVGLVRTNLTIDETTHVSFNQLVVP